MITTRNYFKPMDVNSYIGYESCHYAPWIRNIPKGQFKRLKINCTKIEDFLIQSNTVKGRFLEQKYDEKQSN